VNHLLFPRVRELLVLLGIVEVEMVLVRDSCFLCFLLLLKLTLEKYYTHPLYFKDKLHNILLPLSFIKLKHLPILLRFITYVLRVKLCKLILYTSNLILSLLEFFYLHSFRFKVPRIVILLPSYPFSNL